MKKYKNNKPMKNVRVVQTTAIRNGERERYVVGKRKDRVRPPANPVKPK